MCWSPIHGSLVKQFMEMYSYAAELTSSGVSFAFVYAYLMHRHMYIPTYVIMYVHMCVFMYILLPPHMHSYSTRNAIQHKHTDELGAQY